MMMSYPECIIPPIPSKNLKDKLAHDDSILVEKRKFSL